MTTPKVLKIIALLPVGLFALASLAFGIGESAGGDMSGLMHLVPVVVIGLGLWLCWKQPLWGGLALLAFALFRALALIPEIFLRPPGSIWSPSLFILILLPLISGSLFALAGWMERKK